MPATRSKARQAETENVPEWRVRWRAIFFANVLENDLNKWKKIKNSLLPQVMQDERWDGSDRPVPDDEWSGWKIVAERAGIADKIDSVFGHLLDRDIGIDLGDVFNGAKLLEVDDELVKSIKPDPWISQDDSESLEEREDPPPPPQETKKNTTTKKKKATREPSPSMSLSLDPLDKEGDDDEDSAELTKALDALGDVPRFPRQDPLMEVVGKETRKKRGGKKQVMYRVHFTDQPDEEDSWFTPSLLRREHKDGANQIEAFEKRENEGRAKSERKRQKRRGGLAAAMGMLSKHKLKPVGEADGGEADEGGSVDSQPPEPEFKQRKTKKKQGKAGGTSQGQRTFDETLQEKRRGAVSTEEEEKRAFFAIKNQAAQALAARKAPKPPALPQPEHEAAKENVVPSDNIPATFPQEREGRDDLVLALGQGGSGGDSRVHRAVGRLQGEVLKKPQESEYRDWKISGLQIKEDHILVNFTNGRTMSSKQANKIPELGTKLAEMYTKRLLALMQTHKMMLGVG